MAPVSWSVIASPIAGSMPSKLRASVLTPPGRGAVATVRIEGAGAAAIVAECFFTRGQSRQRDFPLDRILYGRWAGSTGEEVVVCRRPAPEETIDIHCHGGTAAVRAILQSLVERGAGEATKRGRATRSGRSMRGEQPTARRHRGSSVPPAT